MNIEQLRDYCLSLKHVKEKMPFGDKILVFTIADKMFCLTDIYNYTYINLKSKPEISIVLREEYQAVSPAYHMNKKHWNSVLMNNTISDTILKAWINESYSLVMDKLSKKTKKSLSTYE